MLLTPEKQEIDHRTLKLLVGLIAILLPLLTDFFANSKITSISASYHEGGWSQSIFVGFLFAIAAFLFAYNGLSRLEMLCSKFAAVGALGVALFPCSCDRRVVDIPYVHAASAAVMFLVLAYFCYVFYKRARAKGYSEANRRAFIYSVCGMAIFVSISLLVIDAILGQKLSSKLPRLIFYGETVSLVAFGISWLTASRVMPFFSRADERFSPLHSMKE